MVRLENTGKVLVDALVDHVARQCAIRDQPSSAVQKSSTKPFHGDIEKSRKSRTKTPSNAPELHPRAFHGRNYRNRMIPGRRPLLPAASTFLPPKPGRSDITTTIRLHPDGSIQNLASPRAHCGLANAQVGLGATSQMEERDDLYSAAQSPDCGGMAGRGREIPYGATQR